jgi:hypothetical protein
VLTVLIDDARLRPHVDGARPEGYGLVQERAIRPPRISVVGWAAPRLVRRRDGGWSPWWGGLLAAAAVGVEGEEA